MCGFCCILDITCYPNFVILRLNEAMILCKRGDPGLAVTKLTRAIALQPQNPDLFKLRAEAYVLLRNYEPAIVNFQKVVALKSDEDGLITERLGIVHCEYGEALYADEKYCQALKIFEKAMEYRPDDKNVVMRRFVFVDDTCVQVEVDIKLSEMTSLLPSPVFPSFPFPKSQIYYLKQALSRETGYKTIKCLS